MTVQREETIGRGGMAVAAAAAGLIVVGWLRAVAPIAPLPWPWLILLWLADGATILLLTRVTLPGALRTPLVLGLIATMLLAAMGADLFAVRGTKEGVTPADAIEAAAGDDVSGRTFNDGRQAYPRSSAAGGASVRLVAGDGQARPWVGAILRMTDRKLGGAAASALRIDGSVHAASGPDDARHLALEWAISRDGAVARCGWTRVAGRDADAMIAAAIDPMEQAACRSVATGTAACP